MCLWHQVFQIGFLAYLLKSNSSFYYSQIHSISSEYISPSYNKSNTIEKKEEVKRASGED